MQVPLELSKYEMTKDSSEDHPLREQKEKDRGKSDGTSKSKNWRIVYISLQQSWTYISLQQSLLIQKHPNSSNRKL